MRVPHPQTLSRALAKAEALAHRGASADFTPAQARALIYETSAQQGVVHYNGSAPSRSISATECWGAAGYPDATVVGCWCGRTGGLFFAISIRRPNGSWNIDIATPALPGRIDETRR